MLAPGKNNYNVQCVPMVIIMVNYSTADMNYALQTEFKSIVVRFNKDMLY
jgi:hypothetical protein